MNAVLASAGALPALFAMWYVDRLDAKRPEPRSSLRRVAIAGALSALPAMGAEYILQAALHPTTWVAWVLLQSFVVAAAVEELGKVGVVRIFIWDAPEFDERMDGIVYGARAGLGFALVENIYYLLQAGDAEQFWIMFIGRALLAIPGHATWAGIMGYYAARRRFDHQGPGFLGGYLAAVALHGSYDASVFALPFLWVQPELRPLFFVVMPMPVIIIVWGAVTLRRLARRALAGDDAAEERARAAAASVAGVGQPG